LTTIPEIPWLPSLILLEDYGGTWEKYCNALYNYFEEDFLKSHPIFEGKNVLLWEASLIQDKHERFWHIIEKEGKDGVRRPRMRCCERIRWTRAIIENYKTEDVFFWDEERYNRTRTHLCLGNWDYTVVLLKTKKCYYLFTAFYVEGEKYKKNLQNRYNRFKKTGVAV
jgi:hypothetical protein